MTVETIQAILAGIDKSKLQVELLDWEIEIGENSTGDPAVWIWLILGDDEVNWKGEKIAKLREFVRDRIWDRGGENAPWPYIHFRAVSEKVDE